MLRLLISRIHAQNFFALRPCCRAIIPGLVALRGSLAVVALIALLALFFTGMVPAVQAADEKDDDEDAVEEET